METKERPLEDLQEGDVVVVDDHLHVVSSVETSKAGKSGSKNAIVEYRDGDARLKNPADMTVSVLDVERQVEPMVTVGGEPEFDPRVVRIPAGSKVVWFWSGEGGRHRVVGEDFESDAVEQVGYTFERTFDEAGTYPFRCETHGTRGLVVVERTE